MPNSRTLLNLLFLVLASPVYLARFLCRLWREYRYLKVAAALSIPCTCGQQIALVGSWRCGCGFTYRGHLLGACPVCGRMAAMVRCYNCGLTTKLPEAVW